MTASETKLAGKTLETKEASGSHQIKVLEAIDCSAGEVALLHYIWIILSEI